MYIYMYIYICVCIYTRVYICTHMYIYDSTRLWQIRYVSRCVGSLPLLKFLLQRGPPLAAAALAVDQHGLAL